MMGTGAHIFKESLNNDLLGAPWIAGRVLLSAHLDRFWTNEGTFGT